MIRRLRLENWRAYEHLDLELQPGATFVVAANGVGKSSIVEAARYALFGAVPPAREGAPRVSADGPTSASVEVELPTGRLLTVTRPYPSKPRAGATPEVTLDGDSVAPDDLVPLLAHEYGAETSFLARLAMLHSSTIFTEAKGLDLREHLSKVFGVDGLVAALTQVEALAREARKAAESARKIASVSDDELAQLAQVEALAADATATADVERTNAEAALAVARAYGHWKSAADAYGAVATDVATDATALLGRAVTVGDLPTVEAEAQAALDTLRQRRAEIAGRMAAIRTGLAELEGAEGSCPVCRRPLEPDDVATARASHEAELAALEAELAPLDEALPVHQLDEIRRLRARLTAVPAPADPAPEATDLTEADALARFDAAVATAAERRAILDAARERRTQGAAARVELENVTAAYERVATLEAAANALEMARQRILNESIEPLEDLLAENWRSLFVDRPHVAVRGDGTVSRRVGDGDLAYEQFSDGEKMVAQLILRVLVLRATTKLGFFWVDEPLEHLDPDSRRALAVLLAQAPEEPSFRQVLVTTYEEPLIRRLDATVPGAHVVYVRPSLN